MRGERARFAAMDQGSAGDFLRIDAVERAEAAHLADRLLTQLEALGRAPTAFPIDRLQHSLQTAARAEADGADDDMVVGALLHDVGDLLAPFHHDALAGAILAPYLHPRVTWIVTHHAVFQGHHFWHHLGLDRDARERHRGHRWFDDAVAFCRDWDQASFDAAYPTPPLDHFEARLRAVFSREPWGPHTRPDGP